MEKDLTQGSIKRRYFKYLGATFGGAMISWVYGMVDAAVVGQYQGPQGSAALSIVMPIWTILYSLGLLLGIGGSVNYSYFRAQGKAEKANAYFTLSLTLTSVIAVICWVGIALFDEPFLRLFGADDELLVLAKEYLKPVKYAIPMFPFSQFLAAFLRNDNAPDKATFAVLVGGIFNVFGDIFFVFDFGLGLGIYGAGLATAIGCTMTNVILVSHFFAKKNTLKLNRIFGPIHKTRLVTANGFSSFVSDMAMGIVALLFNRQIMHHFGANALAVFGVIVQVSSVVQCSSYGVGQAIQPIISANYGAGLHGRIREARKYALWTVAVFGIFWTMTMALFPNIYVQIFMSPTEEVLQIAPDIMRIYGIAYLMLPLNILATYYFPSIGKPSTAMAVSLARGIVICGGLVFLLPAVLGSEAIWWVMPITELAVAIYVIANMKKQK